jgi:murein tripeptide amidase MpaA
MKRQLPEHDELLRIVSTLQGAIEVRTLCEVDGDGERFPIYAIGMGSRSPEAPAIGFFGGVHGLERVGTQVLLSFLESLLAELERDETLQELVSQVRLIFVPLVNPAGMAQRTRSNANGVDLMRNAPLDSPERVAFLLGGHR